MLELSYRKCDKCGEIVELNGCGSTSNIWMRQVTGIINALYPISQKLFRKASDAHDMAYHQGLHGKRVDADQYFLLMCLDAVENPEDVRKYIDGEIEKGYKLSNLSKLQIWIVKSSKWWFRYQAKKYHLALETGGETVYPKAPCTCKSRKFD